MNKNLQSQLLQLEEYVMELESRLNERISRVEQGLHPFESQGTSGQPTAEIERGFSQRPDLSLDQLCDLLISLGIEEADRRQTEPYPLIISLVEKRLIERVLTSCSGIQTRAAERLGINRNTLHKKTEEYGISMPPPTSFDEEPR